MLPLLLQFLAAVGAVGATCADLEPNVNYGGYDLNMPGAYAATIGDCCAMCEAASECQFFTFCPYCKCTSGSERAGCCHTKTSKAGARHASNRTSGRSGTYKPPPPPPPAPAGAKNVLLMLADDLRPQLMAAYDHPWMKTPNIDKFTETATVFLRAYVQQQVCSPSRNSFMTGRSPDKTGVWNFNDDFRVSRPGTDPEDTTPGRGANWTTMPQYFKQNGYQVYGTGKTFHPNRPVNNDLPLSWTAYRCARSLITASNQALIDASRFVGRAGFSSTVAACSGGAPNASCNGGKPVYETTRNASTGEGFEWKVRRPVLECCAY